MKSPRTGFGERGDISVNGQDLMWFDQEERYLPLIDEGDDLPSKDHWAAADSANRAASVERLRALGYEVVPPSRRSGGK